MLYVCAVEKGPELTVSMRIMNSNVKYIECCCSANYVLFLREQHEKCLINLLRKRGSLNNIEQILLQQLQQVWKQLPTVKMSNDEAHFTREMQKSHTKTHTHTHKVMSCTGGTGTDVTANGAVNSVVLPLVWHLRICESVCVRAA